MDAVTAQNKKCNAQLKLIKDGLAQDILALKRQVRPLIPALHQVLLSYTHTHTHTHTHT